jgi:protein-S-isoprenylcysteine O-methyltransferase Ste14
MRSAAANRALLLCGAAACLLCSAGAAAPCAAALRAVAAGCARWGAARRRVTGADVVAHTLLLLPLGAAALVAATCAAPEPRSDAVRLAAAALGGASLALCAAARRQIDRDWARHGRGLCTAGLRARVRHPQHAAELLFWVGMSLPACASAPVAALVPAAVCADLIVVAVPDCERRLTVRYGPLAVAAWRRAVPCAVLPGLL